MQISIITITRNNIEDLKKTIRSVENQQYSQAEYIVIDGNSDDGSVNLLANTKRVDKFISEPDEGIYDAMNKGIALSDAEWLIFMNAGDEFASPESLSAIIFAIKNDIDVIYSDWIDSESKKLIKAKLKKMNVNHQSIAYRKSLHKAYGNYLASSGVTISDYLFFMSIAHKKWVYISTPISICELFGASSSPFHFYQRIASELIFKKRPRVQVAIILLLYPTYHFLKHKLLSRFFSK